MLKKIGLTFGVLLLFVEPHNLLAQKKIVILGSSTAAGTGSSTYSNSWVGKLSAFYNQNPSDGLDTIVYNLAVGGYSSYEEMPTTFIPPANRPAPDPAHNLTAALSLAPDVIIVNLPTNDIVRGYRINEAMNNFRQMSALVNAAGSKFFVTTAQPRNEGQAMRDSLLAFKDSIIVSFGLKFIDFWSDIVTQDGSNMILPEVSAGDGIHVNDLGHNYLFIRVKNKQIFAPILPLPLKLISFTATPGNNVINLSWATVYEEPNTSFSIEKSSDGINFSRLTTIQASGGTQQKSYSWTDHSPEKGLNLYRIRIAENNRESLSGTVRVNMTLNGITISKIYSNPSGELSFNVLADKQKSATIRIINNTGETLIMQNLRLNEGAQIYHLPVQRLPSGCYILYMITTDNKVSSSTFVK